MQLGESYSKASRPQLGLDGFQLKVIALILMTLDHIHYAMSTFVHAPIILTQLGRISAPLFIFLSAQGLLHTRSRSRYLAQLYIASVLMSIGNAIINQLLPLPGSAVVMNNIFATLWLSGVMILVVEALIKGFRENLVSYKWRAAVGLSYLIGSVVIFFLVMESQILWLLRLSMVFVPNVLAVEGSVIWIGLGVGFYFVSKHIRNSEQYCKRNCLNEPVSRRALVYFYLLYCIITLYLTTGMIFTFENLFLINYQWLMVGALPLLMLYNGKKGKGLKWMFYVYYPVHIYLLAAWAHLMG